MTTIKHTESPSGHIAIEVPEIFHKDNFFNACDICSMCVNGYCKTRDPHSCCAIDRTDGCNVFFCKITLMAQGAL